MPSRAPDEAVHPDDGWWRRYGDRVPDGYRDVIAAEEGASRIVHFHPTFVPGLLQTEAYATAITPATTLKSMSTEDIAALVAVRMTRQRLAFDEAQGRELVFLVDESALHRPVGTPGVMREQLAQLVTMAERPAVTLVVLPFHGRPHPGLLGAFTLIAYRGGVPDVLCFDGQLGNRVIPDRPPLAQRYRKLVADMLSTDPDGTQTRRLIASAQEHIRPWSGW